LNLVQVGKSHLKKADNNRVGASRAEQDLVDHLTAALRKSNSTKSLAVTTELDCFQGIADVVSGVYSGYRLLSGLSKKKLRAFSFSTSKVLAALAGRRRATITKTAIRAGLSLPTVKSELSSLQSLGLLRITRGGQIEVRHAIRTPFSEIVAYEVKVKDWKSGIYQARNYKSFAHKVSVALPLARANRLAEKLPEFRRMHVGLVGIGPQGGLRWLLKPRRRRPISPPRHFHAAMCLLGEIRSF